MNEVNVQLPHADAPMGAVEGLVLHIARWSQHIALLQAWIAMCGSLFFSDVLGWAPCLLCWYQRILMYPLAIVIPIGILRRDRSLHLYVLPVALLGAFVALYHYLLIKTDFFPPPACTTGVPCTVDYIDWLGIINIPFMALTAFLVIALMMVLSLYATSEDDEAADEAADEAPDTVAQEPLPEARLGRPDLAVFAIILLVVIGFVAGAQAAGA